MVPCVTRYLLLDTCAGVDNKVDEALVRRMAGVTDRGYLFEISDAIAARDSVAALGKDFRPAPAKRGHAPPLHGAGGPLPQPDALCPAGRHLAADRHRRLEEEAAYLQRKDFPQARRHNALSTSLVPRWKK